MDLEALRKLLCERLCEDVGVEERPDGALMLRTRFEFPDGDRYPIHLAEAGPGGLRLSDRGAHAQCILATSTTWTPSWMVPAACSLSASWMRAGFNGDGGAFCLDTPPERLPEAIFAFGQALTRVYDLTLLSRSNVGSTFYDDLADLLFSLVDETKIEQNYQPEVPNPDVYPVDYRIEGRDDIPLFLYGVPNRDKARLTTIMLSHFTDTTSVSSPSSYSRIRQKFRGWTWQDSPMSAAT